MDIKKLKNFVYFKLPFRNPNRSRNPFNDTLVEIRVFEVSQPEPVCPICGSLLEDSSKSLGKSADAVGDLAPIESSRSDRTDIIKPYPPCWECRICKVPVIFNENPDKEIKPIPEIAQSSSR